MYLHIVSDFTVLNVFQNSHTTIPLLYKISGVWGNHEGSMLLWLVIMITYSFFFSFNKNLESNLKKCNETYGTEYIPLNYLITNIDDKICK